MPFRPIEDVTKKETHQWDPDGIFLPISSETTPSSGCSIKRHRKCIVDDPIGYLNLDFLNVWSVEDMSKSGKLLRKPPIKCEFQDEHEMRRVYSMIYDVFRCKYFMCNTFSFLFYYFNINIFLVYYIYLRTLLHEYMHW